MNPDGHNRLLCLDIFRGATIAGMIFFNNLRAWIDTPRLPRLTHAEWHGCTLVDVIFPFFIFIVGVSAVFSMAKRSQAGESLGSQYRHLFIRTGALFLLGLVTGGGLLVGWLFQAICPPAVTRESIWAILFTPPAGTDTYFFSLANLRIMGVLQRIALVYLAVSLLLMHTRWRTQALVAGALLLLYWGLMSLPGFQMEPGEDLGAFIDRAVFGEAHLWRYGENWDPEGMLGTLPAIATGLCGALTGHWLKSDRDGRDKLIGLFLFGFFGIFLGTAWDYSFPLNKYLWTSSFVVYTAGYALMFLALWYWLTEIKQLKPVWTQPLVWLGTNPLVAYCGAEIGGLALGVLYIGTPTQHTHLISILSNALFGENWDTLGITRWRNPRWPSFAWATIYLSFWTLVAGLLYRKRLFFKL